MHASVSMLTGRVLLNHSDLLTEQETQQNKCLHVDRRGESTSLFEQNKSLCKVITEGKSVLFIPGFSLVRSLR